MTSFFGTYKTNFTPGVDPKVHLELLKQHRDLLNEEFKSGVLKEAHQYIEGNGGWFVTGDISDEKLYEVVATWSPYVEIELHKTIPLQRAMDLSVQSQTNLIRTMSR